jgi:hypothetical protein
MQQDFEQQQQLQIPTRTEIESRPDFEIQIPTRTDIETRPDFEIQPTQPQFVATQQDRDIAVRPRTEIESNPMVVPVEDRPPPTDIAISQLRDLDIPMEEIPEASTVPSLEMQFRPTGSLDAPSHLQPHRSITNRRRTPKPLTYKKSNLKGVIKKRTPLPLRRRSFTDLEGDVHASHYGQVIKDLAVRSTTASTSDPYKAVIPANTIPLPPPPPKYPELVYKVPERPTRLPIQQVQQTIAQPTYPIALPSAARQEEIEQQNLNYQFNLPPLPTQPQLQSSPKFRYKYVGPPLPPLTPILPPNTRGSKRLNVDEPIGPPGKYLTYEKPTTIARSIPGLNQCDLCGKNFSSKFNLNRHRKQEVTRLEANRLGAIEYIPESDFTKWTDKREKIVELPQKPKPGDKRTSTSAEFQFLRKPKRFQSKISKSPEDVKTFENWE